MKEDLSKILNDLLDEKFDPMKTDIKDLKNIIQEFYANEEKRYEELSTIIKEIKSNI
jgi:hypothetical protein